MGTSKTVRRLGPIIESSSHPSLGTNIQGPSLIKVPDWVADPLGRYYLYFADHKGTYIRMAFADDVIGPWIVYPPGALRLADSHFPTQDLAATPEQLAEFDKLYKEALGDLAPRTTGPDLIAAHIASPDVHVDHDEHRILMYFHGLERLAHQVTRAATSRDGVAFEARPEIIGRTYFRAFDWHGMTYGLAMPGQFYRSADGLSNFEEGPCLFNPNMRHCAVRVADETLEVYWTQVGDTPERIYLSTIELTAEWMTWSETEPVELLRPELPYEGADEPLEPSYRSTAEGRMNQLRDPAIFEDGDGRVYLLYAVAGESGIALAELV